MRASEPARRTVMVFLRDRERDIGTGFKTQVALLGGEWDHAPWQTGAFACDCVRGHLLYVGGEFACGTSRFAVEQVVDWQTGRAWTIDPAAERARRVPPGPHGPARRPD